MSKSKNIGTAFETLIVRYLKEHGFPYAERRALTGNQDKGDVTGVPGVVLECKRVARMDLAGWVDEATVEAINAAAPVFAVVHRRKGKAAAGEQYVTLPLWVFVDLIQ